MLFLDVPADIRILAKTIATGGLRGNLSKYTFHQEANHTVHKTSSSVALYLILDLRIHLR